MQIFESASHFVCSTYSRTFYHTELQTAETTYQNLTGLKTLFIPLLAFDA